MDTILVVEDSRPMQRTLQRLFEADGLQVRIASDGVGGTGELSTGSRRMWWFWI